MKLLLLYPQLANKPKQRLSQTGAQLHGIAQGVRSMLDLCTSNNMEISEFAYEHGSNDVAVNPNADRSELKPVFDESDLVIDIASRPDINVQQNDFAGPVINLSPAFSGSFVCNDIAICGRGRLLQSDVVSVIDSSREPYNDLMPSTHELDANMHYAAFSPLPTRIGDAFYRNEKDHALVFLNYQNQQRTEEIVNDDLQMLSQTLHTLDNLRSLTFVCETLADVSIIQQMADVLQKALGIEPRIWGLRKGEYHDMFSIMAKSNLVLFGGNSLYADAVIRGIPSFPWRSEQAGADVIASAYKDYLEHRDRDELVRVQRKALDRLFEAQYLDATIPNHRACFHSVLTDLIQHAMFDSEFGVKRSNASLPEWVIPAARMSEARGMSEKSSRSVWSNSKTLLQFKQSSNYPIKRNNSRDDRQVFTRVR